MKTVYGPDFKMHIIPNKIILLAVIKDLQNRFDEVLISDDRPPFVNENSVLWDLGGSLFGKDIKFSFRISDDFSLLCRSQHWMRFKKTILSASQTKGESSYLKIHSQMYSLCLTEDEASRLMTQIMKNSFKFDRVAEITMNRLPELAYREFQEV